MADLTEQVTALQTHLATAVAAAHRAGVEDAVRAIEAVRADTEAIPAADRAGEGEYHQGYLDGLADAIRWIRRECLGNTPAAGQ